MAQPGSLTADGGPGARGDTAPHHHPPAFGGVARRNKSTRTACPPYEVLDAILSRYMEDDQGIEQIVAAGFERAADVERVTSLIKLNEYKRRQSAPGIRITHRAFGRDWRYPITSKFRA